MIKIKTEKEIEKIRKASHLAARVLSYVKPYVKAGVSTRDIEIICHDYIKKNGATSATLNYHGFPGAICTSINNVVCHGIPCDKDVLKAGDILNVDVTVIKDSYLGDTSKTFIVGQASEGVVNLVNRTEKAMYKGIEQIKPGASIAEIGKAIEGYVDQFGYSVVRDYGGHGIGSKFHEEPHVHHFYYPKYNIKLRAGMVFTVEPMINIGSHAVVTSGEDGWTVKTADGSLSAQFEHTILVTEHGYEILTIETNE